METGPTEGTIAALRAEMVAARQEFPGREHLTVALMEEVGELANALLTRARPDEIRQEAIQVACVALRICEEGDADFG